MTALVDQMVVSQPCHDKVGITGDTTAGCVTSAGSGDVTSAGATMSKWDVRKRTRSKAGQIAKET